MVRGGPEASLMQRGWGRFEGLRGHGSCLGFLLQYRCVCNYFLKSFDEQYTYHFRNMGSSFVDIRIKRQYIWGEKL